MSINTIQIYGRVRPLKRNSKLKSGPGRYWISAPDSQDTADLKTIGFHIPKDIQQGLVNHQRETYEFGFNNIFNSDASQEEVFDIVAKPVVESCLKGYNGTIFAYGQTGSGKTFTITGGAEKYADRGLIPRTLQYIFQYIEKDKHSLYEIHVSYLEIYNEIGYDLLDNERDAKKLEDLPRVTLQEDSDEIIHLKNLSVVSSKNEEEALNLLFVGDTNRMIAETPSNPASSRSHCVFIISITSRRNGSDVIRKSKLHLVDLAGSERVSKTGIDGNLLKEARHINLSLHYLEQVIIALQGKGKKSHVPYRNSFMTSVLRDSLGGNCKTTMIATLAVEDILIDESISTCRFAQRVALISNTATLNEELDPQLVIARLKLEITRLKAELAIARGETNQDEELPTYELERVESQVDVYINEKSPDAKLIFSDFRKIQHAFKIMKRVINSSGTFNLNGDLGSSIDHHRQDSTKDIQVDKQGMNIHQIEQIDKLKKLAQHRDNEINILVGMITKLKEKMADAGEKSNALGESRAVDPKSDSLLDSYRVHKPLNDQKPERMAILQDSSTATTLNLKKSIPQLSTEKARAFEIFKQSYPASDWIERQKNSLKSMYADAKRKGEYAQNIRLQMKMLKDELANPELDANQAAGMKTKLTAMVKEYKSTYASLKECKSEVEHLQHLLEQGRIRMTRDFEAWYVQVYLAGEQVLVELNSDPSVSTLSNFTQQQGRLSQATHTSSDADGGSDNYSQANDTPKTYTIDPNAAAKMKLILDQQLTARPIPRAESAKEINYRTFVKREVPGIIASETLNSLKWKTSSAIDHKSAPTNTRPFSSLDYNNTNEPNSLSKNERPGSAVTFTSARMPSNSVREDIEAFYKARSKLTRH